ncbi:MAG TPA: NAD(P)-dependent oxidoreductase [Spirochaetaceae bacterium]|jgi:uncharacterized protein YbjT (DUF2867 family)|nr:NAD(P)-dependent oxidoreductase [Spirochaetaceae bacterium]
MGQAILVTGASGNVGRPLVEYLLAAGESVVAAVSSRSLKPDQERLYYRAFDFTDPQSWEACLEGVDRVFLMRPPHISKIDRDIAPFLRRLKDRGLRSVVFLSVQGAESTTLVPHHRIEELCAEFNLPYTFLRPSFFMQNLSTTHLPEIRDERRLFVPAGNGRTNFIDVRDIAELAALVLRGDGHPRTAYSLCGPKSYSYGEVAAELSVALGRPIRYDNPGALAFLAYHLKRGRSLGMSLVMLALYTIVKLGKGDSTTDDARRLLGRDARSLSSFLAEHKPLFLPDNAKAGGDHEKR